MLTHIEFTNAVMRGIQRGNRLTIEWSGGRVCAQDQGAEYLLTVEIARELQRAQIKKNGSGFVLLESKARDILEDAPSRLGRLESALRIGGRVDVRLLDQSYRPIGLVEVKRMSANWSGLTKDASRLAAIMRRMGKKAGGSIRHAAVAALRVVKDSDIASTTEGIKKHVQQELRDFTIRVGTTRTKCSFLDDENKWYSHALCITLHDADSD